MSNKKAEISWKAENFQVCYSYFSQALLWTTQANKTKIIMITSCEIVAIAMNILKFFQTNKTSLLSSFKSMLT